MQHAEAAVALDLDPTSCNEVSLVQNFVDTMPKRSRGSHKRKISPNSATALFNKGKRIGLKLVYARASYQTITPHPNEQVVRR